MLRGPATLVCLLLFRCGIFAEETPASLDGRPLDTPPKIVRGAEAQYPEILARAQKYYHGTVAIRFVVSSRGEVSDIEVTQATHPAFVPPAVEKLLATKFIAGTAKGSPVAARMSSVTVFNPDAYSAEYDYRTSANSYTLRSTLDVTVADVIRSGVPQFNIPNKSSSTYPPALQYDEAPQPLLYCTPVYPRELLTAGTEGDASIKYFVDYDGRVAAAEIISATKQEFGAALLAAVEQWQFTPAKLKGRPTATVLFDKFQFSPSAPNIKYDDSAKRILNQLHSASPGFATLDALNEKPRVRYQVSPKFPRRLEARGIEGEATIEFVLDRDGHARFPRIVSATDEEFGWAAATAVQQWIFERPKMHGQPVDVLITIPFGFTPRAGSK